MTTDENQGVEVAVNTEDSAGNGEGIAADSGDHADASTSTGEFWARRRVSDGHFLGIDQRSYWTDLNAPEVMIVDEERADTKDEHLADKDERDLPRDVEWVSVTARDGKWELTSPARTRLRMFARLAYDPDNKRRTTYTMKAFAALMPAASWLSLPFSELGLRCATITAMPVQGAGELTGLFGPPDATRRWTKTLSDESVARNGGTRLRPGDPDFPSCWDDLRKHMTQQRLQQGGPREYFVTIHHDDNVFFSAPLDLEEDLLADTVAPQPAHWLVTPKAQGEAADALAEDMKDLEVLTAHALSKGVVIKSCGFASTARTSFDAHDKVRWAADAQIEVRPIVNGHVVLDEEPIRLTADSAPCWSDLRAYMAEHQRAYMAEHQRQNGGPMMYGAVVFRNDGESQGPPGEELPVSKIIFYGRLFYDNAASEPAHAEVRPTLDEPRRPYGFRFNVYDHARWATDAHVEVIPVDGTSPVHFTADQAWCWIRLRWLMIQHQQKNGGPTEYDVTVYRTGARFDGFAPLNGYPVVREIIFKQRLEIPPAERAPVGTSAKRREPDASANALATHLGQTRHARLHLESGEADPPPKRSPFLHKQQHSKPAPPEMPALVRWAYMSKGEWRLDLGALGHLKHSSGGTVFETTGFELRRVPKVDEDRLALSNADALLISHDGNRIDNELDTALSWFTDALAECDAALLPRGNPTPSFRQRLVDALENKWIKHPPTAPIGGGKETLDLGALGRIVCFPSQAAIETAFGVLQVTKMYPREPRPVRRRAGLDLLFSHWYRSGGKADADRIRKTWRDALRVTLADVAQAAEVDAADDQALYAQQHESVTEANTAQPAARPEPVDVAMPQLGEGIAEGTITKWLVAEGDVVRARQTIVCIATDKTTMSSYGAPIDGTITKLLAAEDATIAVGAPIAQIEPAPPPALAQAESGATTATPAAPGLPEERYERFVVQVGTSYLSVPGACVNPPFIPPSRMSLVRALAYAKELGGRVMEDKGDGRFEPVGMGKPMQDALVALADATGHQVGEPPRKRFIVQIGSQYVVGRAMGLDENGRASMNREILLDSKPSEYFRMVLSDAVACATSTGGRILEGKGKPAGSLMPETFEPFLDVKDAVDGSQLLKESARPAWFDPCELAREVVRELAREGMVVTQDGDRVSMTESGAAALEADPRWVPDPTDAPDEVAPDEVVWREAAHRLWMEAPQVVTITLGFRDSPAQVVVPLRQGYDTILWRQADACPLVVGDVGVPVDQPTPVAVRQDGVIRPALRIGWDEKAGRPVLVRDGKGDSIFFPCVMGRSPSSLPERVPFHLGDTIDLGKDRRTVMLRIAFPNGNSSSMPNAAGSWLDADDTSPWTGRYSSRSGAPTKNEKAWLFQVASTPAHGVAQLDRSAWKTLRDRGWVDEEFRLTEAGQRAMGREAFVEAMKREIAAQDDRWAAAHRSRT